MLKCVANTFKPILKKSCNTFIRNRQTASIKELIASRIHCRKKNLDSIQNEPSYEDSLHASSASFRTGKCAESYTGKTMTKGQDDAHFREHAL